jgi:tetratricopeptide (TPR) repeat protein
MRDLGWILGWQNRFDEASKCFQESLLITEKLGEKFLSDKGRATGFWAVILMKEGKFSEAQIKLDEILKIHEDKAYFPGSIYEVQNWLGLLSESVGEWRTAERYYQMHSKWQWHGQIYFLCCALTGLIRAKHALGDHQAIPPLLAEAEQSSVRYEYNDHLASLQLIQGHVAWETNNKEDVLRFYQHALIYALRYNRFLLDELLSGRPQGSPLRSIIPYCLEHGDEGRQMLITLRDWWKIGVNHIGTPRPDTISPLPEGSSLLQAEKTARDRELGDGTPQRTLVKQLEEAIEG